MGCKMMKKPLTRALIILCAVAFLFLLLWLLIFKWSFISYPSGPTKDDPVICYSPNHEYYVRRYQTPAEAIWNDNGIAIVYDKKGNKIYKEKAYLADMGNLLWSSTYHGAVSMTGGDYDWHAQLPSLPVNNSVGDFKEGCY